MKSINYFPITNIPVRSLSLRYQVRYTTHYTLHTTHYALPVLLLLHNRKQKLKVVEE